MSLQEQEEKLRYQLRSSFYYRQSKIWFNLLEQIAELQKQKFKWDKRKEWGISESAWTHVVEELKLDPVLVFCHPEVPIKAPSATMYYRLMAAISKKGANRLGIPVQSLESSHSQSEEHALTIAKTFNSWISLLIESDAEWTLEKARVAALLNLGSQVNGSWRNEIGNEGGRKIKELLVSYFLENGLISSFIGPTGNLFQPPNLFQPDPKGIDYLSQIRGFITTSEYKVIFSSEPDVSIISPDDLLVSTIEVKYGLDPAGALERYGAAKKSFEHAIQQNPRVFNFYLASCLTSEVEDRVQKDRLVNWHANLTEIFDNETKRQEFLTQVKRVVEL